MRRKKRNDVHQEIEALRQEIDDWRMKREKRGALPETFWLQATELARRFGVSQVARHLKLHHTKLKSRVESDEQETDLQQSIVPETPTFIELKPSPVFEDVEAKHLVVLRGADGSEMTLHLPGQAVDVARLVEAFFRRVR